jgi:predicted transposase/invertase (TIGR01784 family)
MPACKLSEFRTGSSVVPHMQLESLSPWPLDSRLASLMISSPHDALFKAVFAQPEHARGMLRAIVPSGLAEALDWQVLTLRPGSFVDAALAHQHTDLLYSTKWRDGGEALVYFLFEHQSTPPTDGLMAYRLLRYQDRIWERWRVDHAKARTLPMILPIVMYHGVTPWLEPRSFDALLDVPASVRPAVEPYLVRFTYLLNDLSEISDDELRDGARRTALAKLTALCFKQARTGSDFVHLLGRWMNVVREVVRAPHGLEALAQVMRYILEVSEQVRPETLQALLEREIGPEAKDTIVTAGQQLIQQGVEQGRLQGVEQGRLQGFQGLLLRLLRQRFGAQVDPQIEQRIAAASVEQIEIWSLRVLSAATLAELFAD